MLYDVTVISNGRSFNHGHLPPKAHKGYLGDLNLTSKNKVVVSWRVDENIKKSKEITIDRLLKYGDVIFKLDGKDVTVEY